VAQGNQAIWVFLICLGFVYLVLAAQYESFILPLAVILRCRRNFLSLYFAKNSRFRENNIYAQVAMVMLIGLLGKMQY
jgi:HAE1 family hydrophobic/amphiphilic exporter-1